MNDRISDSELRLLRAASEAGTGGPWRAMVEGRDHTSGDSFIMVGSENDRSDDIYVSRGSLPISAGDLDLIAMARTYLPRLLDEIEGQYSSSASDEGRPDK